MTTLVERIEAAIESPIENLMFQFFIYECQDDLILVDPKDADKMGAWMQEDRKRDRFFLCPQAKIGPYRADFLIGAYRWPRVDNLICVECDGKDFHRATAEQMKRDADRDVWMMRHRRIKTMRFSGAYITKLAGRCVQDVIMELTGKGEERQAMTAGEICKRLFPDWQALNDRSAARAKEAVA